MTTKCPAAFFAFALAFLLPVTALAANSPSITKQPQSQNIVTGSNAVFTVSAGGSLPFSYQWSFNTVNLTNSSHIKGATTATLTVSNITAADNGNYQVLVSNSHGSIASSDATLTVLFPPAISSEPGSRFILLSNNTVFAAAATGTLPLSYQWYFNGAPLTDGANIIGSATPNLSLSNLQISEGGNYQLVVTNNYGSATSMMASLTILIPAAIALQPTNQTILLSNNVTFAASAFGTLALGYQWDFNGAPLTDGNGITGSTTANLNLSNVQTSEAGAYQLIVTNNFGSATSAIASLTVLVPAAITVEPTNEAAVIGGTAIFSVTATGPGLLTYQWQENGTNLTDGGQITGSATSTLTISNIVMSNIGSYSVTVSNSYGAASSTAAGLLVVPLAGWGVNYFGEQTFPLTLTNVMAISTGDANLSYLNLMLKADGSVIGWGEVIGTSNYVVTVPAGLSNAAAISAGYRHGLVLDNDGTVVAFGDNSVGQTNTPTGLAGVVAVAAGWDWSLALKNDGTVAAWGDNSYGEATPPPGLSNVVAISVGIDHGLALKNDGTIVGWGENIFGEGSSPAGLSNVVAIAAGYSHDLALKSDGTVVGWGDDLYGMVDVPAGLSNVVAIAASYTLSMALRSDGTVVAWGDTFYGQSPAPPGLSNVVSIAAGGEYGLALLQNPATQVPPAIWWQGEANQTVPSGQTFLLNPYVMGSKPMSFQWYFNGSLLAGQTNSWLMVPSIQPDQAGNYQFTASNNYGSVTSQVTGVIESPGILNQPVSQSSVAGGTITFSGTAAGSGTLFYQWYFNGSPLADDGHVSGSTTTSLTISNVQSNDAGSYELVVTNAYGSATSQAATFTLLLPPAITFQPTNQSILLSNNVTFASSAAGTLPLSYQWYFNGAPLTDGNGITGSVTANLNLSNVQTSEAGGYQLVVTNNYGSSTGSVATLTVLVPPIITSQPTNESVVLNNNASFPATVTGDLPLSYQWYFKGSPLTDGGRVSGSAAATLSIANVQTNDAGSYQLVVTNNNGTATSAVATLTVLVPAIIGTQPASQTVLASSNVNFTITAGGNAPLNYQWYSNNIALANGGRISGATSATLTISNTQTNDDTAYQVIVANLYGSATSSIATLTVIAPVQIIGQPGSQDGLLGTNVTFTVAAGGTGPFSYQWYFNGAPLSDGSHIGGSATASLSITNVQSTDAGGYRVVVSNLLSSATSLTASLTPQIALGPSIRYVMLTSTNPQSPYLDWSTAATNIQDAIDAAVAGDSVVVSNGIYTVGGRLVYGTNAPNRVVINKPISVQSLNGPTATTIVGFNTTGVAFFPGRCVYMTNGTFLSGFTLRNGAAGTASADDLVHEKSGGGVWCEGTGAVISNCVLFANSASGYGGGAFGGTLFNCLLTTNTGCGGGAASNILFNCALLKNATGSQILPLGGGAYNSTLSNCVLAGNSTSLGGGAYGSVLFNCILTNNIASSGGGGYSNVMYDCVVAYNLGRGFGGGTYLCTLYNCTVVTNSSEGANGGGIWGGAATNCIIYYNTVGGDVENVKNMAYCCIPPIVGAVLPGCITNPPLLVSLTNSDFHLQSNSPCINSGENAAVTGNTDFAGNPRIVGGTVDMGAYEYQSPASIISFAWLEQYGLPTDGSVDFSNLDGTGFNVYQDYLAGLNPTNSASVLQANLGVLAPGITITWPSISTRNYYVQRSTNLVTQPFITIQSFIAGHTGTASYTDTSATNGGPYYYRVGVLLP